MHENENDDNICRKIKKTKQKRKKTNYPHCGDDNISAVLFFCFVIIFLFV